MRPLVFLCLAAVSIARAQSPSADSAAAAGARRLDSLIAGHSSALVMDARGLTGLGADALLSAMQGAQFVAFGERHGVEEIPQLAGAMLTAWRARRPIDFFAGENGGRLMELVLQARVRRDPDSMMAFARRYPSAFEFNADADLRLVGEAAGAFGGGDARAWGLDQEFGALVFLDTLRKLNAPVSARRLLDSIGDLARRAEARRYNDGGEHWLARSATPEMFAALRRAYGASPAPFFARTLDALETSAAIYTLNRRAGAGEAVGFTSNDDREQYMKREFVRKYRALEREIGRPPRGLIKMGQAHLGRGQSPFGPFTVGNLLSELAMANGMTSVHVAVLAHNPRADSLAPSLWTWSAMRPLATAVSTTATTVVDLRPLRRFAYANRLGPLEADLRRLIYAYDFVVIIGGAHAAREG